MKKVNTRIHLTLTEARGIADILRLIANMEDCDEITGKDIEDERKSAKRLYNRLYQLLLMSFIGKI